MFRKKYISNNDVVRGFDSELQYLFIYKINNICFAELSHEPFMFVFRNFINENARTVIEPVRKFDCLISIYRTL